MTDPKSLLAWAVEFVEREIQPPTTANFTPEDVATRYAVRAAARRWLAEAREYLGTSRDGGGEK